MGGRSLNLVQKFQSAQIAHLLCQCKIILCGGVASGGYACHEDCIEENVRAVVSPGD